MGEKKLVVLMAEDNKHDRLATERAWEELNITNPLVIVNDGEQILDYLYKRGKFSEPGAAPRPGIVLLDIKMPRVNGIEVLKHIRDSDKFHQLPVIMLTSSKLEEDRLKSYNMGATAYIEKPLDYENFTAAIKAINMFWTLVELPG
ncbi:hypothetical protein MNBD_NITROSPINAE02-244 [hydrothermal vent metagenome]|uniref:Response regulatory domain-containing protein n=1 Tax=hydrothermal vent metagenome TaxID=652676 RepID=A0A3B1CLK2_9ZZZZ